MSTPIPAVLLSLWYEALHSPRGLKFPTPDPLRAKTVLYKLRAEAADPNLQKLMIRTSPTNPGGELWIIHTHDPQAVNSQT